MSQNNEKDDDLDITYEVVDKSPEERKMDEVVDKYENDEIVVHFNPPEEDKETDLPIDDKGKSAKTAIRRRMVFELRKTGMIYEDVAREIRKKYREDARLSPEDLPKDYGATEAARDMSRWLSHLHDQLNETAKEMVLLEVQRIDQMINEVWKKIDTMDGENVRIDRMRSAINTILDLQQRKSKFLGLDDPEKVQVLDQTEDGFDGFGWADPDEAPRFKKDENEDGNNEDD